MQFPLRVPVCRARPRRVDHGCEIHRLARLIRRVEGHSPAVGLGVSDVSDGSFMRGMSRQLAGTAQAPDESIRRLDADQCARIGPNATAPRPSHWDPGRKLGRGRNDYRA